MNDLSKPERTDADRLSWLDAQRFGLDTSLKGVSLTIFRDDAAWRALKTVGPDMPVREKCSTLREAIDKLMDAEHLTSCHVCGATVESDENTCAPCGRDYDREHERELDHQFQSREP
jgi:hypothetical protein